MAGACGSTNLTSSSRCRRRQFSTALAQPWPVSPSPWAKMTVAVCLLGAGNSSGAARRGGGMVPAASASSEPARDESWLPRRAAEGAAARFWCEAAAEVGPWMSRARSRTAAVRSGCCGRRLVTKSIGWLGSRWRRGACQVEASTWSTCDVRLLRGCKVHCSLTLQGAARRRRKMTDPMAGRSLPVGCRRLLLCGAFYPMFV